MPPTPEFPYQDGDVTVLGPEIFASKGGSVISWRGENYIRPQDVETTDNEMTVDALRELSSAVRDLASAMRLEGAARQEPAPHMNIQLCGGPVDASEIGAQVARTIRKARRGEA